MIVPARRGPCRIACSCCSPARRDAAAAPPLSATLGDGLRDPREEPLFVGYAMPVQLQFLADRLDLERIGWRYRAARDSTAPEAR
jgi:hypothetical protein